MGNSKLRLVMGCALARSAELLCDFLSIPPLYIETINGKGVSNTFLVGVIDFNVLNAWL